MSGDYCIQDLGGKELALHYPDQGLILNSDRYYCLVQTELKVEGVLSWLRSFEHCNSFRAMLSGSTEGLRIEVTADQFAIFIPWPEATVAAERGRPATIVRLNTEAVPSLTLIIHLDDEAADDLFRQVVPPLPRRDPPQKLFWLADHNWVALIVLFVGISVGLIAWLLMRSV